MRNEFSRPVGFSVPPSAVVDKAREYLDTPYRDWGRAKGKAADCIGLVICVANDLNLVRGDFTAYAPTPKKRHAEIVADANMREVVWSRPGWDEGGHVDWNAPVARACTPPGSVGLFWFSHRQEPTHFAIFADHPAGEGMISMIHAHARLKRVTENGFNDFWRKRLVKSYWLPGVYPATMGAPAA